MATVLITGANRGIGLELCHQYADRGDDVIAVCRSPNADLEQPGITVIDGIDVADDSVIGLLAEKLAGQPIDILLNNAGILTRESLEDLFMRAVTDPKTGETLAPGAGPRPNGGVA